jgi:hypothetical protein
MLSNLQGLCPKKHDSYLDVLSVPCAFLASEFFNIGFILYQSIHSWYCLSFVETPPRQDQGYCSLFDSTRTTSGIRTNVHSRLTCSRIHPERYTTLNIQFTMWSYKYLMRMEYHACGNRSARDIKEVCCLNIDV